VHIFVLILEKKNIIYVTFWFCIVVHVLSVNKYKPRGASPGREDGISTNNLVLFYGVE